MQATIANPVSCFGIGVHSGKKTQLTMKPAKANTGIIFIRQDVTKVDNIVVVSHDSVSETTLSTAISNEAGIKVSTIEHLMAAIWGCGIDNLIIELDGEEVPIMDGSSLPFVFLIEYAGIRASETKRKYLKLLKEVAIVENGIEISARPSDDFTIDMTIEFASEAIGRQQAKFHNKDDFKKAISPARTFGFAKDLVYLRGKGLAKGASLENAIGIEDNKILNEDGLRFADECVRHKLLDSIGDFFAAGRIIGSFECYKSGHKSNNQLLRKILQNQNAYEFVRF